MNRRFQYDQRSDHGWARLVCALLMVAPLAGGPALAQQVFAPTAATGLGLIAAELPFQAMRQLGIEYGVRVVAVAPGGPAATSGLRPGDVLISLQGRPVYSVQRLAWLVAATPGEELSVELLRGGERVALTVASAVRRPPAAGPSAGPGYLGVLLQEMNPELRAVFGAPAELGVLIVELQGDGPALAAGLRVGDVVLRIDRKSVARISDLRRAVDFFGPGAEVELEVVRDGERKTITVTLTAGPSRPSAPLYGYHYFEGPPLLPLPDPEAFRAPLEELLREWEQWLRDLAEPPGRGGSRML